MRGMPTDLRAFCRNPLLLGALTLAFLPALAMATGQVGEAAPDFTLVNSLGETVEIVFGQGEVYLLNFIGYA